MEILSVKSLIVRKKNICTSGKEENSHITQTTKTKDANTDKCLGTMVKNMARRTYEISKIHSRRYIYLIRYKSQFSKMK